MCHSELFYKQLCIGYCITIWGYAVDQYLSKIRRIMNRDTRIKTRNFEYGGGIALHVVKG